MNNQEAFNKAVLGVVAQGGPSLVAPHLGASSQCAYRAENGRKCAVGHLIEDDDYTPQFEDNPATVVYVTLKSLEDLDLELLNALQYAHDTMYSDENLDEFIADAKDIAIKHNLTFPEAEVKALLDLSKEVELA